VSLLLAALLAGAAVATLLSRDDPRLMAAVRASAASRSGRGQAGPGSPAARPPRRAGSRSLPLPVLACALAGLAVAALVAAPVGLLAGAAVAVAGPRLLARLEPQAVRAERERLLRDLPLLLDLLAACLAGGAHPAAAAEAVGQAVPGPAGRRLLAVRASLAVGMPASEAWASLGQPAVEEAAGHRRDEPDPYAPAARALARAAEGGAPVAQAVSRLAAEARADARSRGEQAARRVGVLAVAPLGLCFLPAFVLIGVVPVIIGLAQPLLSSF